MVIARTVAFFWGLAACGVIAFYGAMWLFADPAAPLRNELRIGAAMGLVYGLPAWVSIPFLSRQDISAVLKRVLLAPLAVALFLTAVLVVAGGYDL